MTVPNVLATRYAGADLAQIWSPEHKIVLERQLWIAVLRAQRDLGIDVPDGVVEAYEAVVAQGEKGVDLESIATRERVTRHDVKARIEEFNALASHEHIALQYIHGGMTSRDLTENVEQLQVRQSLELLRDRAVAALARLARLAAEHESTVMAGRSHNVAAQATTLGKRFATVADEMLIAVERVEDLLRRYPLRGARPKTQPDDDIDQDMLDHIAVRAHSHHLRRLVVFSGDGRNFAEPLEDLSRQGTQVVVVAFSEVAGYAISSDLIEFIDIEDVPGAFTEPLDRVRLDALPADGAWLRPTRSLRDFVSSYTARRT